MSIRRAPVLYGFCIIALGIAASMPASAGGHLAGIRISQTGQVDTTVSVDVSVFYTVGATTFSVANLGKQVAGNRLLPAINWGDGEFISETALPLAESSTMFGDTPVRLYRGSFSHTYGAFVGQRTVRGITTELPGDIVLTGAGAYAYFYDGPPTASTSIVGSHTFIVPYFQNNISVTPVPPFFADGFEAGDFSGWSKVVSGGSALQPNR